jgi:hypothetical protein
MSHLTDQRNIMVEPNYSHDTLMGFQSSLLRLANLSQAAQPEQKELAKEAEAIEALCRRAAPKVRRSDV